MNDIGIAFVVEKGDLEQKAVLLSASIRKYGRILPSVPLYAIKPTRYGQLSPKTLKDFKTFHVKLIEEDLNREHIFYPVSNKIYAAAFFEKNYGRKFRYLAFLDTDLLVLQPLSVLLSEGWDVAIKPDDNNLVGLLPHDKTSPFWQMMCDAVGYESLEGAWTIQSTVNEIDMKPLFNSGLIITKSSSDIFGTWLHNFKMAMKDKRLFEISYLEFYFIDAAILSLSIVKTINRNRIHLLGNDWNYPLHLHSEIKNPITNITGINVLHYHDEFKSSSVHNLISANSNLLSWLSVFVPQKSPKKSLIRKLTEIIQFQRHKLKYKYILNIKS